jgi:plastocyanin
MRTVIAAAGAVAAIAFTGCGGDDSSSTTSSGAASTAAAPATAESTDKVQISDFKFVPETITVKTGTEVTWSNSDDTAHTATADDGSFDTGTLDQGDSKGVTFDQPGTFSYFCKFHAFMKGTIEVQ